MSFDLVNEPALDAILAIAEVTEVTEVLTPTPAAKPHAQAGDAFTTLGLSQEIVKAITHAGYPSPTDVQARAVPAALTGQDLMVSSQTGSGKTAAFVWPALQRILDARRDPEKRRGKGQANGPRILILAHP